MCGKYNKTIRGKDKKKLRNTPENFIKNKVNAKEIWLKFAISLK